MVDSFRVLGSVIGTPSACDKYIESKIEKTATLTEKLSKIAITSPQNAYSCYTKGVQNKLSFLTRTTPEAFKKLDEIEKNLRQQLIPSITDKDRNLFALPLRMGGLGLLSNTDFSKNYEWSRAICDLLENSDTKIAETEQTLINRNIKTEKQKFTLTKKAKIMENCSSERKLTINFASQKGASNWLSVLPLKKYNFPLNKLEFKDGLHLRYGWEPPKIPHTCPCGQLFTLTHSIQCPKVGYTHLRHNEIRDTFATLLDEVCHDNEIEPKFQSLEGESFHNKTTTTEDDARPDIKANGLWGGRFSRIFFDVKIFNPNAKSCPKTISDAYKYHESVKTLKYQQRILDVEHSSSVPLIFACTRGAAPDSTKTVQKLAEKLSEKRNESYSDTINYIRTKISFALLRSAILCFRGCKKLKNTSNIDNSICAVIEEGRF